MKTGNFIEKMRMEKEYGSSLGSNGTVPVAFVKLTGFFTGRLGFNLAVFSLIVAESIVFCLLKLLVTAAEVVMV